MPDNEWDAVDVRGHYETTEFRVCGLNSGDMVETGIYTLLYNSTSKEMVLTVSDVVELDRLDFILYKNALTEEEEEQRDIDFYNAMDSDGDGVVDASDASNVLAFYSTFQTGGLPDIYTSPNKEAWIYYCENIATNLDADSFPDFDGDGKSDASDASQILAYYSYRQTHTFEEGMTEPEIMRIYRTTVLELNLD